MAEDLIAVRDAAQDAAWVAAWDAVWDEYSAEFMRLCNLEGEYGEVVQRCAVTEGGGKAA